MYFRSLRRLVPATVFSLPIIASICFPQSGLAWELPATPPTNTDDGIAMPNDLSESAKASEELADKGKKSPPRVRIGLKMTPYRKVVYSTETGTETQFKPDMTVSHTLRARMDRPNHFFINDFHIETTPQAWDKDRRIYKIRLTFHRRFGSYGQIEEVIGNIELEGALKGEKGLYVLNGLTSAQMKNKRGQPVVDVTIGYSPAQEKSTSKEVPADKNSASIKAVTKYDSAVTSPPAKQKVPSAPMTRRVNPLAQPTVKDPSKNPWEKL